MSSPEAQTMFLINGNGRIGLGVCNEVLSGYPRLLLGAINTRTPRDPFESVGAQLISDRVYGQAGPVENAYTVDLPSLHGPSSIQDRALSVILKNGDETIIPFSASETSMGIDWREITEAGYSASALGDRPVSVVIDASTMKTGNFAVDAHGRIVDKQFERRHPGHHLAEGTDLVIVTSPLDLGPNVDGYDKRVPTIIGGVNDDAETIRRSFEQGEFCFSASSCSTGAIATLLSAMSRAGIELRPDITSTMHISHANTESDSALIATDVRPSRSGAQSEVARILANTGANLQENLHITCNRVPSPTGSSVQAFLHVMGRWTTENFVEIIRDRSQTDKRYLGIEERVAVDSVYIRGDKRTAVVDATGVSVQYNKSSDASLISIPLWFDNEAGYAANVVRLARRIAGLYRCGGFRG